MAAKKKTKKKTARRGTRKKIARRVAAESPCKQRGPELPSNVYVSPGQTIDTFLQICGAAANVVVTLHYPDPTRVGGTPLFSGRIPPGPNPLTIRLPPLSRGVHVVMWTYAVAGIWDVVAELQVDGAARFRKINSHDDGIPVQSIWTYLEVS